MTISEDGAWIEAYPISSLPDSREYDNNKVERARTNAHEQTHTHFPPFKNYNRQN
jgi:hypothetical protein